MMKNKAIALGAAFLLVAGLVYAWNMNSDTCCSTVDNSTSMNAASVENTAAASVDSDIPQAALAAEKCATTCKTDAVCCKKGELQTCTAEEAAAAGCVPCPDGSTPCCTVNGVPYCKG